MEDDRVKPGQGRCHICGELLGKDYNGICPNHTEEEIQSYYDAIEEY